ncbi:MAG: hypothetical protein GXO99_00930 [Nitrospirae bacterium]|nr:hypothetical protein [Nitrospirota bacterium]
MMLGENRGYILVTTLLLLVVLTVIGMAALSTSRLENILSGNIRLRSKAFTGADSATEIAIPIIHQAVRTQNITGYASIVNDNTLATELRTTAFDNTDSVTVNPDITVNINDIAVNIDVDKMYIKRIGGTAIEFASGYEGIGKSGASGFYAFYRINTISAGAISSEARVGSIYRYVPK